MKTINALPVEVYRSKFDCTNNGISSRYNELLVVCPDGHIKVDAENPPENLFNMSKINMFGKTYYRLEPYNTEGKWYMFGGNFGYTSDSRFSDLVEGMSGAVKIFDRHEGKEYQQFMD